MSVFCQKKVAPFKTRSAGALMQRNGPCQCNRACDRCFPREIKYDSTADDEILLQMICYDDLNLANMRPFQRYRKILYHPGQMKVLRDSMNLDNGNIETIYIIFTDDQSDIDFLNQILTKFELRSLHLVDPSSFLIDCDSKQEMTKGHAQPVGFLVPTTFCGSSRHIEDKYVVSDKKLHVIIDALLKKSRDNRDVAIQLIGVSVSKDMIATYGLSHGSVCFRIQDPYLLEAFRPARFTFDDNLQIVEHLYHDIAMNTALLPAHIVAFLIMYADQSMDITIAGLTNLTGWIQKTALNTKMQLAFTGSAKDVVEYGLYVLHDYIVRSREFIYITNEEVLMSYANAVTPYITYRGLIARCILAEYNLDNQSRPEALFSSDMHVKVKRDNVIDNCNKQIKILKQQLPICAPCMDPAVQIQLILEDMQVSDRYFKIIEPKIKQEPLKFWAGDYCFNDEYQREAQFKADHYWIMVYRDEFKRQQLNTMMAAIEPYMMLA